MKPILHNETIRKQRTAAYYRSCKELLQLYEIIKTENKRLTPRLPHGDFRRQLNPQKKDSPLLRLKTLPRLIFLPIKNLLSGFYIPQFRSSENLKEGIEGHYIKHS